MKKHTLIVATALATLTATAQETYQDATLLRPELNGTARYVGMGGAMEALGADISTIGTNPAGIGLFRHSTANLTFGVVSQQDAAKMEGADKTHASFDQAGFVYSMRTGRNSFLNFAFNYTKSRDFNHILQAAGRANYSSQNQLTYDKANNGVFDFNQDRNGFYSNDLTCSQADMLHLNYTLYDPDADEPWGWYQSDSYNMLRQQYGYIGNYDLNISGNIKDKVYLGMTVGIHDVHYNSYSEYDEVFSQNFGGSLLVDERRITGTGFDVKAGIIVRPIDDSPFRFGLSVSTPTFYDLTATNYTELHVVDKQANRNAQGYISSDYDFRLNSPWKFGASIGHTIGNMLALGVSYEFADYGKTDNRIIDGYDYYGYETSSSDRTMNNHTEKTLKAVSTLKVGAELRPDPSIAVRLGFNYVSPMFEEYGYKDGTLNSFGNYYSTSTDYTNWEATYRVTAGIGYRLDKFNIDLAYQYNTTNGTFSPYYNKYITASTSSSQQAEAVKVSDKRHQLQLTLGYTF
ncbi:MAG: OmpP1/FadL family transporter [Prevotella sp.]